MLSALLRSGDIKNYTALGQDGVAVYSVASQLRDSIKFKRGRTFADYLAIPQRNDQGSQIDWYIPFESDKPNGQYMIIPWTSATQEERDKAWGELQIFERTMLELGSEMISSPSTKGDQLLFARLLCSGQSKNIEDTDNLKALRFPNPEHVYLVNDRPVITFWGFTEKNASIYGSPFLNLRPSSLTPPINPEIPHSTSELFQERTAEPAPTNKHWCRRFWWILPLLLLLGVLLCWLFRNFLFPYINWFGTPTVTIESNVTDETKIVPKECEIRKVSGSFYYFVNNRWMNESGVVISDSVLLNTLEQTAPELEKKCIDVQTPIPRNKDVVNYVGDTTVPATVLDTNAQANQAIGQNGELPTLPDTPVADDLAKTNIAEDQTNAAENQTNATDDQANEDTNQANKAENQDNPKDTPVNSGNQSLPELPIGNENNQVPNQQDDKKLTIPSDSQQDSQLNFLNGEWNAGAGIQDKTTGKPLRLNYKFNDGKGQVELQRGDGVKCTGNVVASMNSGKLNIDNTGIAKCSDGSTYQLPSVSCKANAKSSADCQGQYEKGQRFPMIIKSN
ncbi:SrfA family protein [Ursidibacter sp. B-7004-1]